MCENFSAAGVSHMLDNFLFIGPRDSRKGKFFLSMCAESDIPIKKEKTISATTVLTIMVLRLTPLPLYVGCPYRNYARLEIVYKRQNVGR